jgi:hypothetical protein
MKKVPTTAVVTLTLTEKVQRLLKHLIIRLLGECDHLSASSLALLESNNLESIRSISPPKKNRTLASTGIGCLWTSTSIADSVGSSSLDGLKRFGEGIALGALSGVDMAG